MMAGAQTTTKGTNAEGNGSGAMGSMKMDAAGGCPMMRGEQTQGSASGPTGGMGMGASGGRPLVKGAGKASTRRPGAHAAGGKAAATAHYSCPMHPDVRASRPGQCPKCHMALVKTAK